MKRFLLTIVLLVLLCPLAVQASSDFDCWNLTEEELEEMQALEQQYEQKRQAHEDYLNEIDWLTENDPSFSFADQFCEDYGIQSYRELEEIMDLYYFAMDIGFESYSDMEDASIAQYIIEEELGEETVDELRDFQEKYGYGSIDELLQAVDEIGYSEITEDYSNFSKESAQTISAVPKTKDEEESVNYGALVLCGIAVLSFYLVPYFVSEHLKKKKKGETAWH